MRAVRYLLRVSALMMVGVAVFCGLVLLLNAQALLNRYAELYMMDAETSSTPILNRHDRASNRESATSPVVTSDPERARGMMASPPAPPASSPDVGRVAIHVSDAEGIAAIAAADRFVDVILTRRSGADAAFSEAVLENVKVLAIEWVDGNVGERPAVHAVTLDVDRETAENLVLASRSGRLSLVLHRPIDKRPLGQIASAAPTESPPPVAPDARQVAGAEISASASVPVPDAPAAVMPEVADAPAATTPAAEPGDERFRVITVNRVGGPSSVHRVPRER